MKYHKQAFLTIFLGGSGFALTTSLLALTYPSIGTSTLVLFLANLALALGIQGFGFAIAELVYRKLKEASQ